MKKKFTDKHTIQRTNLLVMGFATLGLVLMSIVIGSGLKDLEEQISLLAINRLINQDQYRFAPVPVYLEQQSYDHSQAIKPVTEALWGDLNAMILSRTSIEERPFTEQQPDLRE